MEEAVGGVALFANADAGDIDPGMFFLLLSFCYFLSYLFSLAEGMCNNEPNFVGSGIMAKGTIQQSSLSIIS